MTQFPSQPTPMGGQPGGGLQPHRGTTVLVLGILGLVVCPILGIVAWVMGSGDLRAMQAGQMDPTGLGLTKAGKICGMIGVILAVVGIVIWIIAFAACGAATTTVHVTSTR